MATIQFPCPLAVHSTLSFSAKPDKEKYIHAVADMLASLGFNEIISNSLTKSADYKELPVFPEENLVRLLNPLKPILTASGRICCSGDWRHFI
jgi:phenylalanyl-tRNA synthetase beta subunit